MSNTASGLDLSFKPPVIAHRGARARAPENTMASFRLAREEGALWIEADVKLTQDGVPVLMHDDKIDRTTNSQGPISDLTWETVQTLDAGNGERVPRLTELLQFVLENNMRLNIELKPCPGRAQATAMVTLIQTSMHWKESVPPPLISSFDVEALTIAAGLHPEWPRSLGLEEWREDWMELVQKTYATAVTVNEKCLDRTRVQALKDARLPVLAFTVNDPARGKELLQWGVTAVFSDNPREMIAALG